MDWHKYPKSRKSIRIRQPETLDSIKCHTFPGFRGKTLDILWHDLTLQFFFAKCINSSSFLCDTGPAFACMSTPVWLAYVQVNLALGSQPKADSGQHRWLRQSGCRASSGPGPAYQRILCRPSKSVTAGCQLHSNLPPFKLLALPSPLGRSAPPHQRLQGPGLLRCHPS
jgi:hypothetical protein